MLTLSGVSLPSTPASAVPYSETESRHGSVDPSRSPTSVRHSSEKTSPAMTSFGLKAAQSTPFASPASTTSLRNGG